MSFGAKFISCWIRILIWNADPDPGDKFNVDPCGSGSETLLMTLADIIPAGPGRGGGIFHFTHPSIFPLFCSSYSHFSSAVEIIYIYYFLPLIIFGGPEVPIVYILLCRPQRTVYSEVPSQMAAHLRTGSPL